MKNTFANSFSLILASIAALSLSGCWTPPNASVQPKAKAGLIQDGIVVPSVKDPATVQAINHDQNTITLACADGTTNTYKTSPDLKRLDQVQAGQTVKASVTDELAVYSLDNGRLPDGTTAETLGVSARVQQVDPSYRLLTLQFSNGQTETFKPGLKTLMQQMEPGDSVVVKPLELTAIKIEKP